MSIPVDKISGKITKLSSFLQIVTGTYQYDYPAIPTIKSAEFSGEDLFRDCIPDQEICQRKPVSPVSVQGILFRFSVSRFGDQRKTDALTQHTTCSGERLRMGFPGATGILGTPVWPDSRRTFEFNIMDRQSAITCRARFFLFVR